MIYFDFISGNPKDELQSAFQRVPSNEFAKIGSFKGRAICVYKICYHAIAGVGKPVVYVTVGLFILTSYKLINAAKLSGFRISPDRVSKNLILTGLVAPLGQIVQLFKAVLGILHPGFYFKEDILNDYCLQLADIAEEIGGEQPLVETLKQGSHLINKNLQTGLARMHYQSLIVNDLALICKKLKERDFSSDQKLAILKMLVPEGDQASGLYACCFGLGRLLEQICSTLEVPQEPEKIVPWLAAQYKEEVLAQIIFQREAKGEFIRILKDDKGKPIDSVHYMNMLIVALGEKIGLPNEVIEKARKDFFVEMGDFFEEDKQKLLDEFHALYTEEALVLFLMQRINSQPDGKPGLKALRTYIMQKLADQASDAELEASKPDIQKKFNVDDEMADDPGYYVMLHYFLHPEIDRFDDRHTDLNEKGIRAFANMDRYPGLIL